MASVLPCIVLSASNRSAVVWRCSWRNWIIMMDRRGWGFTPRNLFIILLRHCDRAWILVTWGTSQRRTRWTATRMRRSDAWSSRNDLCGIENMRRPRNSLARPRSFIRRRRSRVREQESSLFVTHLHDVPLDRLLILHQPRIFRQNKELCRIKGKNNTEQRTERPTRE